MEGLEASLPQKGQKGREIESLEPYVEPQVGASPTLKLNTEQTSLGNGQNHVHSAANQLDSYIESITAILKTNTA